MVTPRHLNCMPPYNTLSTRANNFQLLPKLIAFIDQIVKFEL